MLPIVFIPLDNRPCCWQFVERLATFRDVSLIVPPAPLLGSLTERGQSAELLSWLANQPTQAQYLLSLDMLAWGGLVGSRRPAEGDASIRPSLMPLLLALGQKSSLCCFSTIMRVAPTQKTAAEVAEAERLVNISRFLGERFQNYADLESAVARAEVRPLWEQAGFTLGAETWNDYWRQRQCKQAFHRHLLCQWNNLASDSYLLLGFDDSQTRGLNILEATELRALANDSQQITFTTGADELAQLLLVRLTASGQRLGVEWSHPDAVQMVTRYEDVALGEVLRRQLNVAQAQVVEDRTCRKRLFVWAPPRLPQQESVCQDEESGNAEYLADFIARLAQALDNGQQVVVGDVAYANGGCRRLVKALCDHNLFGRLSGYAAWNTAGNTLGTALATLLMLPDDPTAEQATQIRRFLWERFADDYLYETVLRRELSQRCGGAFRVLDEATCVEFERIIQERMADELCDQRVIADANNMSVTLPWKRLFEVSVEIKI